MAEGIANLTGGFFQCLPGSGSLTRSAINFQAGAVTRASGIFTAVAVALVVAVAAPLARFIPKAALAGLLMVTAVRLIDRGRTVYALRASRFDAALVVVTAFTAVFVSVEFSILAGVALSILLFVPRAARLNSLALTVGRDRVIRGAQTDESACQLIAIADLEGELFFGAAPELEAQLDRLKEKARQGVRVIVLRLRRVRHPDLVCLEHLEHFLHQMEAAGVAVLLSGVRDDLAQTMHNLRFESWLPQERVFRMVADVPGSSTIAAVRAAYSLLGDERARCPHCANIDLSGDLYYLVP